MGFEESWVSLICNPRFCITLFRSIMIIMYRWKKLFKHMLLCSVFLKDSVFIFNFSLFADQVYLLFGFYDRFYDLGMLKDGLFFFGFNISISKDC